MAKRRMCELTTLWKDRSIPVALKMRLVKTLVWTVLSYGAEAWTLKVREERNITSMEMWLWRRMLRISWMEKRTDNSVLQELEIKRELLGLDCFKIKEKVGMACVDDTRSSRPDLPTHRPNSRHNDRIFVKLGESASRQRQITCKISARSQEY